MPGVARVIALVLVLSSLLLPQRAPSQRSFDGDRLRIQQLLDRGSYEAAVQQAANLMASARSQGGPESLSALRAFDLLVEARVLNGEGALSTTLLAAQNAVVRKRRLLGENHVEVATSLRNLGMALTAAGQYEPGRIELERATHLVEHTDPPDAQRLADVLHRLGDAEIRTERYDAAERTLARALSLREKALGNSHQLVAQTLERVGYLLLQRGRYVDARAPLERALKISEVDAASHPETALLLDTLGTLSWFEGDVAGSERYYRRALQLSRQTLAREHPSTATYLRDLSVPLWELGRASEARELRRDALALGRRTLGNTHPEVAWQLNELGNSQLEFGEYPEARRLYEEALAAITKSFGPTHLNAATILHNLALLDAYLGDSAEASRRLKQAEDIWQRVLGPSHPYVGRALDSLAQVYRDQGRYAEARPLLERALRIRETTLGPNHREVAESLTNLATLLVRSGSSSEAQELLSRATAILNRAGSTKEPLYATALALTGEVLLLQGKYDGARKDLESALGRRVTVLGSSHPLVAATKVGLASALIGLGRQAEGLRLALDAEASSREHLRLTARYLSEHESLSYAATRQRGLDLALSASGQRSGTAAGALLDAVVRSRALVLDEMSTRLAATRNTGSARIDAALAAVVAARERLASLLVRGTGINQPAGYAEMLAEARREVEAAERQMAGQSAEFRAEMARQQAGLPEVRRNLPQGAALISFVRYDSQRGPRGDIGSSYVAFVLPGGTASPVLVRLGAAAEIERLVQRWRVEVARGALRDDRQPTTSEQAYRAAGLQLRLRIWDPVVASLAPETRVFIVPDGAISLVSFASLPVGNDRYLADDGRVLHYLAAERDLLSASIDPSQHGTLLAIGGPDFGLSPELPVARNGRTRSVTRAPDAASLRIGLEEECAGPDTIQFEPLLETAREVAEIASIWRKTSQANGVVLTGSAATEQALKQRVSQVGILHLATHGFFLTTSCPAASARTRGVGGITTARNQRANALHLSGLAFAGANLRGRHASADDGVLTAEEVASLDLRQARWVVLSACDTGIGQVMAGEGVLGLRRAFHVAGAQTLIMSLWAVDDAATRRWMRVLYEGRLIRKLDTALSVRQAQLAMLHQRRAAKESTHPFYWASFVAVGNWR